MEFKNTNTIPKEGVSFLERLQVISAILKAAEEKLIETKSIIRRNMEAIIDAPGPMQSASDTTRYQLSRVAGALEQTEHDLMCFIVFAKNELNSKKHSVVELGALVLTEENGEVLCMFLAPASTAKTIMVDSIRVETISISSPVGESLLNHGPGDVVEISVPAGVRHLLIRSLL